jgi:hypothetical protein
MATYCNECGSGNPDGSDFCTRCGAAIAPAPVIGDLVLPEWLTRAAAESADPAPAPTRSRAVETEARRPSPLPPIPTGDLPSTMPDWLKRPIQPVAADQSNESLLTDPTDTRGFITEDDLPAWIREIAAADTNRKAVASEPATPEAAAEPAPPVKRRLLPGEIDSVRSLVNPSPPQEDHAPVDEPLTAPAPTSVAFAPAEPAAGPRPPANAPGARTTRSFGNVNLRLLLIGAIFVVVAILIIAIVLL